MKSASVELSYRLIKDPAGTLSRSFATMLARQFALTAFVETGTFVGDTVAALTDDFERIVSIELSRDLWTKARARFAAESHLALLHGDSAECLAQALNDIRGRSALIWLDAHFSGGATARGLENTPVLRELECLDLHGSRSDVVLIDDLRYFWDVPHGLLGHEAIGGYPDAATVVDQLKRHSANYDCFVFADALVAVPGRYRGTYAPTPVLAACTEMRISSPSDLRLRELEQIVSSACGSELTNLVEIPQYMNEQAKYGLGGHYFYWRALIREAHRDAAGASSDFDVARRCGVFVPERGITKRSAKLERR
jgi:hypothetical protein